MSFAFWPEVYVQPDAAAAVPAAAVPCAFELAPDEEFAPAAFEFDALLSALFSLEGELLVLVLEEFITTPALEGKCRPGACGGRPPVPCRRICDGE